MSLEDILVAALYAGTALSSAFNASYFATYRAAAPRRRLGAVVLALVSLGLLVESGFFGLVVFFRGQEGPSLAGAGPWLLAGILSGLSSILITALILRQLSQKRRCP